MNIRTGNGHLAAQPDRIAAGTLLQVIPEVVGAVRDVFNDGPRLQLGIFQQVLNALLHLLYAITSDQLLQAELPAVQRSHQRLEIPQVLLRDTAVVEQQAQHLLIQPPGFIQLDRSNPDAFHMNVIGAWRYTAGNLPADIRGMDEAEAEGNNPSFMEIRLNQMDIRQMGNHAASRIRIITDHQVAFLPVLYRLDRGCRWNPE
ncbi:hypothetical protein D3C71_1612840 [compost metagenome]